MAYKLYQFFKSAIFQRWFGGLIVCLSLGFIAEQVWGWVKSGDIAGINLSFGFFLDFTGALLCCYAGTLALALAWLFSLQLLGEKKSGGIELLGVYCRTLLIKYLPGNIAHLAGRHVGARRQGFGDAVLIAAGIYEIAGLVFIAFTVKVLLLFVPEISVGRWWLLPLFLTLLLPFMFLFFLLFRKCFMKKLFAVKMPEVFFWFIWVSFLQLLFFMLTGCALLVIVHSRVAVSEPLRVISIFMVAWLAGFITPGAPGGVGIREAVMIALLQPQVVGSQALVIAVLFRLVTLLSDMLVFGSGVFMGFLTKKAESKS